VRHAGICRSGGIAPLILDSDTKWAPVGLLSGKDLTVSIGQASGHLQRLADEASYRLYSGIKWPGREVDLSPFGTGDKSEQSYIRPVRAKGYFFLLLIVVIIFIIIIIIIIFCIVLHGERLGTIKTHRTI
jgi:hypothetical protein